MEKMVWEEPTEHTLDFVKHYSPIDIMSKEIVEKKIKELLDEVPELYWIPLDYPVVSVDRLPDGTVRLLLQIEGQAFLLVIPPRSTNPYHDEIKLVTAIFNDDEELSFSDRYTQHGIDIDDPEEFDEKVSEEQEEHRKYKKEITISDSTKIIIEGTIRAEKCFINIPHYHYYPDFLVTFITKRMHIHPLLKIASPILMMI